MSNRYFNKLLFSAIVILISCGNLAAQIIPGTPNDILPAAKRICSEKIESFRPLPYFNQYDILSDFRFGAPFPFFILDTEFVYSMQDSSQFGNALKLINWRFPIYLGSVEKEPRTLMVICEDEKEDWRFCGAGGDAMPIVRAREKWPTVNGYRHALVRYSTSSTPWLIMIEKNGTLQFWNYNDEDETGDWLYGLSRDQDGSWPAFTLGKLINIIKGNERYFKPRQGLD